MEKIVLDQTKLFGFKILPSFGSMAGVDKGHNVLLSAKVGGKPIGINKGGYALLSAKIGGKPGAVTPPEKV